MAPDPASLLALVDGSFHVRRLRSAGERERATSDAARDAQARTSGAAGTGGGEARPARTRGGPCFRTRITTC